jgi:hypothetical protein
MNIAVVNAAMQSPEIQAIGRLMDLHRLPEMVHMELVQDLATLGDRSWIRAGLGAIATGHGNMAAAIAVADFFSSLEVKYGFSTFEKGN